MKNLLIRMLIEAIIAKFGDFRLAKEEREEALAAGFTNAAIEATEEVMNLVGPSFVLRKLRAK